MTLSCNAGLGSAHNNIADHSMGRSEPKRTPTPRSPKEPPVDFAAQFNACYRVLWLVAVGIVGDASAAEDVVQEAALLALGKIEQFKPGTNFRAWMAQMVRFVALNHARKRQSHRAATLEGGGEGVVPSVGPKTAPLQLGSHGELPADQEWFDDQMTTALNSVSETARACLLLRTIERMEYSEISRLLEIPEGTAMSHVHRTRHYLRERLSNLAPMATSRLADVIKGRPS
jgi:RNA polymerase sigma-70 factor (ECF subfamily)